MNTDQLHTRWMTIDKAAELTGLAEAYLHERTGPAGLWAEGKVWKWFDGRKLVDLHALYLLIDKTPSVASKRGRTRKDPCPAPAA